MTTSIDTINLSSTASLSHPDVTRLTTKSVDGTGVFDVLMAAVKQHLLEEYEADRVTGEEYTKVYLGALQGAMQTAVQFLLNSKQEEQLQAEIAYTRQKTVTELAQTDDTIPDGLGFNGTGVVEGLVKLQKDKLELEGTLVEAQITQSESEIALIGQKVISELAQTGDDLTLALTAGHGYNISPSVFGMLQTAKDKIAAEVAYAEQQVLTEAETTLKVTAETAHITQSTLTEVENTDKVTAETAHIAQSTLNEIEATAKTVAEKAHIVQSTLTEVKNTEKVEAETEYTEQRILTEAATLPKINAETSHIEQSTLTEVENTAKAEAETAYTVQRTATESATLPKIEAEIDQIEQNIQTEIKATIKMAAEAVLIEQQTVTELANTSDIKPAILGAIKDTAAISGLIHFQKEKLEAEVGYTDQKTLTEFQTTLKVTAETAKETAEKNFITQKTATEVEEKDRVIAETNKTIAEITKVGNEAAYIEQQTVTELANTSDTKPVGLGEMTSTTAITGLVSTQKDKVAAELTLLAQKTNTELAQTADLVKTGSPYLNSSTSVTGVIDKQKSLYAAQTTGFTRDAEQKVMKVMADAWCVLSSAGTAETAGSGFDNASVKSVIDKAKNGIGVA